MTCPKCRANVPDASFRCPGCGLIKPKVRATDTTKKLRKVFGDDAGNRKRVNASKPAAGPPSKTKRFALVLGLSMVFVVLASGAYWFVWPLFQSQGPEPETAAMVLEKLRKMPSNHEGLTVEESVTRELEKSRRVGNLVGYQGWIVREAPGDKSKLLVIFSFDERDNARQSAEWLADPVNSTFTPQTELAAALFNQIDASTSPNTE